MANGLELTRWSQVQKFKNAMLVTMLALIPDADESTRVDVAAAVTTQVGTGAPTHTAPDASTYRRTDAVLGSYPTHYTRVAGAWVPDEYQHWTHWQVLDDFYGKADTEVDHGWILNSGSDGAAIDPAIDTAQQGGIWKLVSGAGDGTTAVDGSGMVWADMPIQLDAGGGITIVEARVRINTAITGVALQLGLTDSTALEEAFSNAADVITSNASDAVAFLYDSDATTKEWFGVAVDTDADDAGNATTGAAPVADTWQILRIEIDTTGATINFFVDNALAASLALAASTGVGPNVVLYPFIMSCSDGVASKTCEVDFMRVSGAR